MHFDYLWSHDKNSAIDNPEELAQLQQLPEEVQNEFFREYLYKEYLELFSPTYFRIPKDSQGVLGAGRYFTWEDRVYRDFMIDILTHLRPRRAFAGELLFKSLESVEEVLFIAEGSVDVGYEINAKTKFVIRLKKGGVIGSYNCTFNVKTKFIYMVYSEVESYVIQKKEWHRIMGISSDDGQ